MDKEFKTWIVLDYKSGTFKTNKRKPTNVKASEILIDLKLNIKIPEQPTFQAKADITLSEVKATEIVLTQVDGGQ